MGEPVQAQRPGAAALWTLCTRWAQQDQPAGTCFPLPESLIFLILYRKRFVTTTSMGRMERVEHWFLLLPSSLHFTGRTWLPLL